MKQTDLERIMQQTGREPSACDCAKCRAECLTPCMGTPHDILRLFEAGYASFLEPSYWVDGLALGMIDFTIRMIRISDTAKGCPFQEKNRCRLHESGLKPIGGKLSDHTLDRDECTFERSLDWNIAREWVLPENTMVVTEVFERMRKHTESEGKYRTSSVVLIFNASRKMIAMAKSLKCAAWLTGGTPRAIACACQGTYVTTAGLYFRRYHPGVLIDHTDWEGFQLEQYDALCGEHRRYYSREKMKSLREEFEKKRGNFVETPDDEQQG